MINTIIFDLGGVLIDWNPDYLYKKIFNDEQKMREFLSTICTPDWNEEQDAGRSLQEGTDLLISKYPEQAEYIKAYYGRWEEMLGGNIPETVEIFSHLKNSRKYQIYALTNWSAETFEIAKRRFNFLSWFDGIVVSGTEKTRKPHKEFYQILLDRYTVDPANAVFIDDNLRNIKAANDIGIHTIYFTLASNLKEELERLGVA